MTITIHQAKTHFSRWVAKAEAGEEILITRGKDQPTVKLIAIVKQSSRLDPHPDLAGSLTVSTDAPLEEPLSPEAWGNLGKSN